MSESAEVPALLRAYYTEYYRDVLGIPDWAALVAVREHEERQEARRVARLRHLVGDAPLRGSVLNVGCGTGGFNVAGAEAGVPVIGVDADAGAIAVCAARRRTGGGRYVRARSESLPFADDVFDLVYCFSVIEHVESVDATIAELVRVTRRGGFVYLHTPNVWSFYEGHYKLFWVPFLPRPLGRLYLGLRGRPAAYLGTVRRLTAHRLRTALRRCGVSAVRFYDDERPREALGPLRLLTSLYYRLTATAPFIELVARKS